MLTLAFCLALACSSAPVPSPLPLPELPSAAAWSAPALASMPPGDTTARPLYDVDIQSAAWRMPNWMAFCRQCENVSLWQTKAWLCSVVPFNLWRSKHGTFCHGAAVIIDIPRWFLPFCGVYCMCQPQDTSGKYSSVVCQYHEPAMPLSTMQEDGHQTQGRALTLGRSESTT